MNPGDRIKFNLYGVMPVGEGIIIRHAEVASKHFEYAIKLDDGRTFMTRDGELESL